MRRKLTKVARCELCREPFNPSSANTRYCSQSCNNRHREEATPGIRDQCRYCAIEFVRSAHRTQRVYCSAKCREAVRNNKRQAYLRAFDRLRRLRIQANGVENVSPVAIFERDGWRCWLCGEAVDRQANPQTDDLAATLDHVHPLSKGGPHTSDNLRCAHRMCNRSKGNKVLHCVAVALVHQSDTTLGA